jgi:Flp pilus assembly pilin Flp
MRLLHRLWKDQRGFVISTELILIAVLLVIGLIAGLTTLRDQVVQELGDLAAAIGSINQSYSFSGTTGHSSSTSGSIFTDLTDFCDAGDVAAAEPECLQVHGINPAGESGT